MTREEYLQLLQKSRAYTSLPKGEQEKIAAAQGNDMDYYAKVFLEETKTVNGAYTTYVSQSESAVKGLKGEVKVMQTDFRKKAEAEAVKADEMEEEQILQQISNL